jgi:uncharacterized protein (DUF2147 family)
MPYAPQISSRLAAAKNTIWGLSVLSAAMLLFTKTMVPAWGATGNEPTGNWLVAERVAIIKIVDCGGRLWGVVSWEKHPGVDTNNPDPAKRTRPTLGMPVLLGMTMSQPNQWSGHIYNSDNGRTYDAKISLPNPDVLRVEGCVLGILCGGENWTRVNAQGATGAPTTSPAAAQSPQTICTRLLGPPGSSHERPLK